MNLILALLTSIASFAYVPEYGLIASRTADQHGKGAYQIEQEVVYRSGPEAYAIKETWIVLGENDLRVTLEGRGALKGLVQGTIIYEGSQKSFHDGQRLARQRTGDDWLEPLFHFRSSKYFRSRMVNLKVTPAEALRDRATLNSEGPPVYEAPSFIRLSRVGGAVNWAIGINPTIGTGPTVWIEQDQFVVRKFRGNSQAVLRADEYTKYGDSFWYPRKISYGFGENTVQITTLLVKSLGNVSSKDKRFQTASLNPEKDMVKIPDSPALREFYSRFR